MGKWQIALLALVSLALVAVVLGIIVPLTAKGPDAEVTRNLSEMVARLKACPPPPPILSAPRTATEDELHAFTRDEIPRTACLIGATAFAPPRLRLVILTNMKAKSELADALTRRQITWAAYRDGLQKLDEELTAQMAVP